MGHLNNSQQHYFRVLLSLFEANLCVFEINMSSKRKAEKDEASSSDDSDAEVRKICLFCRFYIFIAPVYRAVFMQINVHSFHYV